MNNFKYIYGPVPSRRMGLSLGVSPLIEKRCNHSCIYCQLGSTKHMVNKRSEFIRLESIIEEFKYYINNVQHFDVVTVVGEGEPTLYSRLKQLIVEIKELVDKPVAVITNGTLLYEEEVKNALMEADIVLPSMDAYDENTYKKINRPYGTLKFKNVYNGLVGFSKRYKGQLWIEIMLIDGINDDIISIRKFKELLNKIDHDRLYINTPVRPPAESWVNPTNSRKIKTACGLLGGVSIENLISGGFGSEIKDNYKAVLSIIGRHPMNQYEIKSFLNTRNCSNIDDVMGKLNNDSNIDKIDYKGYITYKIKEY